MAHLEISLLGDFEVAVDGRPVTCFRTDKVRALLAYLVVEAERVHRRAMLSGLLWPDVPETTARHSLSQALFLLREALGCGRTAASPFLLATRQTLRFNLASDYVLDVAAFQAGMSMCAKGQPEHLSRANAQAMAQALEHYRGEFLCAPLRVNSQTFEEWRLLKRTQLHLLAVGALDCLVQYHERCGEFALAADYARWQIMLEPLREVGHRQYMYTLASDNRHTEALAHYADCRALLAQELGVEPDPETTALYEKIRASRLEGTSSPKTLQGKKPETVSMAPAPAFVGRKSEMSRLFDALALAMVGQGQAMFITGTVGSGKTALITAFSQRALAAHTNLLVINGSSNTYTGTGISYWPFMEMLRQLYGTTDSAAVYSSYISRSQAKRLESIRPDILNAISKCCSSVLERFLSGEDLTDDQPALSQAGLFTQITQALHEVASRYPLVLVLDDLQWADQDSLNLLFHLGRRLAGQHILILGAFRPDVLDQGYSYLGYWRAQDTNQRHPLASLIRELQNRLGDIRIDLEQAEGQAFIDELLDSEQNHLGAEFRELFYQHTGGHALFATELLRGMRARGDLVRDAQGYWVASEDLEWHSLPVRVEAVIAERIEQLLPEWQDLLTVASVEGDEFTVQVVARVLDLPEAEVRRRLSGALTRHHHLVMPVGQKSTPVKSEITHYRFRHLLYRKYLYDQLDPVDAAQLHLSVGRVLEDLYAEHVSEISLCLARHFELGKELDKAVTYLLQAGQSATQMGSVDEALRLLSHGMNLLQGLEKSPKRMQQETELQSAIRNAPGAERSLLAYPS